MRIFVCEATLWVFPQSQLTDLLSLLGTASPHGPEAALQPGGKSQPAASKQHCLL